MAIRYEGTLEERRKGDEEEQRRKKDHWNSLSKEEKEKERERASEARIEEYKGLKKHLGYYP
jgi:hypothetical protein